ncbi:MAG: transcriptional regulator [Chloroflexi bacterium]|nr:transcriptional regulator [Chloroflexota bacterium]
MSKSIVLTLTGHDRVGIVEEVTDVFVRHGGNVEASRMSRLGGEFAILMLASLPDKEMSVFEKDLKRLRDEGYQITLLQTEDDHTKKYAGWLPYEIEVLGADHDGIIYQIAHHLAGQGINIENMDTRTAPAPMSGTPLFTMKAVVIVPPNLPFHQWSDALEYLGDKLNVSIKVEMVK